MSWAPFAMYALLVIVVWNWCSRCGVHGCVVISQTELTTTTETGEETGRAINIGILCSNRDGTAADEPPLELLLFGSLYRVIAQPPGFPFYVATRRERTGSDELNIIHNIKSDRRYVRLFVHVYEYDSAHSKRGLWKAQLPLTDVKVVPDNAWPMMDTDPHRHLEPGLMILTPEEWSYSASFRIAVPKSSMFV